MNFQAYLNELRIRYIAKQLSENPEYLKYSNGGFESLSHRVYGGFESLSHRVLDERQGSVI